MSKRISVVFCLLLVVAMAFSIVGCSSQPAADDTASSAPSGDASASASTDSSEPVELEFWDMAWGPAEQYPPTAEAIIEKYTTEVAPNVSIKYTNLPWSNWFETYSTAVASNGAPDVAIGGGYMPFQFAVNNEAADIGWIVDEWKKEGTDGDFLEGMLDYYVYHDKVIGIPFNYDPRATYYRADLLAEKGLEVPTTYEEFIDVTSKMSDPANNFYGFTFSVVGSTAGPFSNVATGNGGMLYDKDGNANINSERNLQVMKFFRALKDAGSLPDGTEGYADSDCTKLFAAGGAAFCYKGVGDYKNAVTKDGFTTDQVKIMAPLKSPSGVQKAQLCVNGYLVFEQSENKEAAMKFLKWFSENSQDLWDSDKGAQDGFPARQSFMNEMDEFKKDYRQEAITKILSNGITLCYPMLSGAPSASVAEGQKYDMQLMQAALTMDEAGMKDTLEKLNTEFQKVIDEQD
ncbi:MULTISPECIES: sugar ABC transporter substrate-binding protein [unclassified Clostridium]|uniref:ABC transporter substrate-binding protein n=1 Tax=unclassified Clostridium TaxID=2614128 RepID=UPI0014856063|nr:MULTISPECIES: sugar ABC transporter substrate-binding protein [unclassified Clostridium]